MELKGIDVSKWNGKIDWVRVRNAGIQFVMIRAGLGSSWGNYSTDVKFDYNIRAAASVGIKVGVYLYSYARTLEGAIGEGEYMVRILEPYRSMISFPVVYDIEDDSQKQLGRDAITAMCAGFCRTVSAAGYKPMIYSSKSWLDSLIDVSAINTDVWLAQWRSEPTWSGKYTMWQYTDSGSVDGISGNVDMNIGYVDYSLGDDGHPATDQTEPKDAVTETGTPSSWAKDAWEKAIAAGVTDGTRPQDPITREQVITILDRLGLIK